MVRGWRGDDIFLRVGGGGRGAGAVDGSCVPWSPWCLTVRSWHGIDA